MKILFVDINDAESPRTWSGVTSKILNEFRRNHDVILLHKLNKNAYYFCIPRNIVRKLQGFQVSLDHTDIVAWHYAKQVKKAYDKHKPDVVFSVTAKPLAHLPDTILSFTWKTPFCTIWRIFIGHLSYITSVI